MIDSADQEARDAYGTVLGDVKPYRNKQTGETHYRATNKSANVKLFKSKSLAQRHADSED